MPSMNQSSSPVIADIALAVINIVVLGVLNVIIDGAT
jgi:hypothetical protein